MCLQSVKYIFLSARLTFCTIVRKRSSKKYKPFRVRIFFFISLEIFCSSIHILIDVLHYTYNFCKECVTVVNVWPCQQNVINSFQNEANTPLITKIVYKQQQLIWTLSVEAIRPARLQNFDFQRHFLCQFFFHCIISI